MPTLCQEEGLQTHKTSKHYMWLVQDLHHKQFILNREPHPVGDLGNGNLGNLRVTIQKIRLVVLIATLIGIFSSTKILYRHLKKFCTPIR